MSLPKGFGEKCLVCQTQNCICGEKSKEIPITKFTIGKYLFWIFFFGGIVTTFIGSIGYIIIGICMIMFSTLTVLIHYDTIMNSEEDWKKRKILFFWAVPIVNFLKQYKFKEETN